MPRAHGSAPRSIQSDHLSQAVGGDDDAPQEVQPSDETAAADVAYDASSTTRNLNFDASTDLPAPPTIHDIGAIDPATVADLQHHFEAQVDVAQNYEDTASPAQLRQPTGSDDCFNIAMLNTLNAYDPDGMASLVSATRNPNVVNVHTVDRSGNDHDVYVNPWPLQTHGATSSDPNLVSVFNATTLLYHPRTTGGEPLDAAGRVGAIGHEELADEIFRQYQAGQGAAVVYTPTLDALTPEDESAVRQFELHPEHVYQVASVIHNDADGLDYGILRDPYGDYHPRPIPMTDLNRALYGGTIAHFARSPAR